METQTAFQHLQKFHLLEHGDSREREIWPIVSNQLSNYETFWQTVIVLLTNRIDRSKRGTSEWIRLRSGLARPYEDLAMSNYSAFYYAASVIEQMKDNETRISSGKHPRTELVFFYLEMCIENAKRLQRTGRALLGTWGIKCDLPKHPNAHYQVVGAYRNAFAHDPILGRAAAHGRELLPPCSALLKTRKKDDFLRWSDTEGIPTDQMIDGLNLQESIWTELAKFLQRTWQTLAIGFLTARDKFVGEVGLSAFLPISDVTGTFSTASPIAASGTIIRQDE